MAATEAAAAATAAAALAAALAPVMGIDGRRPPVAATVVVRPLLPG